MCNHVGYTEAQPGGLVARADVDLGTSPSVFIFGDRFDASRGKRPLGPLPLPHRCRLDHVLLEALPGFVETLPETVTWWVTADEDGCVVLTDQKASAWVPSYRAQRSGGVAARLDLDFTEALQGRQLFLWVIADVITDVRVRPRLVWHTQAAADLTPEHRCRLGL